MAPWCGTGPWVPGHCYMLVVERWWSYMLVSVVAVVVGAFVGSVGGVLPKYAV
jgi:hypothetical protein